jgi:hypothetical protein
MSGIRRSANRPKLAKHLRNPSAQKVHTNRTTEERERDHLASNVWAERERAKELIRVAALIRTATVDVEIVNIWGELEEVS